MLGLAIDRMEPDALRRVLDAPVEEWCSGVWMTTTRRCLLGHASGAACLMDAPWKAAVVLYGGCTGGEVECAAKVGEHYDRLCDRFGLPRVVRAVKVRALAALERQTAADAPAPAADATRTVEV